MRLLFVGAIALLFCACSSTKGPGLQDGPCAEAQPVGPGSQAAAAAATSGQRNEQAPTNEDVARLHPLTNIARGQGPASQTDSSQEDRQVANGAAVNNSVLGNDAVAEATNAGGGASLEAREAAKTLASYRAMLQCALLDPSTPPDRIEFLSGQITAAQGALALAAAQVKKEVNISIDQPRITYVTITAARTGDGKTLDPEIVKPAMGAAETIVEAGTAEYVDDPSTDPQPAPGELESPPSPAPSEPE